jgi:hypothetical protein
MECSDLRYVSIDCFYNVCEIVPNVEMSEVFEKIPTDEPIFGVTYRYDNGMKDVPHYRTSDSKTYRFTMDSVPMEKPNIRLLPVKLYTQRCCRACRQEFLTTFNAWCDGVFVEHSASETDGNIQVQPPESDESWKFNDSLKLDNGNAEIHTYNGDAELPTDDGDTDENEPV